MNYRNYRLSHISLYGNASSTLHPHAHNVTTFLTAVILAVKGLIVQTKDRVAKWIKKKNKNKSQLDTELTSSPIMKIVL